MSVFNASSGQRSLFRIKQHSVQYTWQINAYQIYIIEIANLIVIDTLLFPDSLYNISLCLGFKRYKLKTPPKFSQFITP